MVQPHGAPVEEVVVHVNHLARQRRHDGRARGGGNVHAAVRIARLAVEHAPQPERAGAPPRHRHLHAQRLQGAARGLLAERGHHLRLVVALALKAGLVLGRQVHRAWRHLQVLLFVLLGRHGVGHLPGAAIGGGHGDVRIARHRRQRYAHHGGPFDGIAQHEHRHIGMALARLRHRARGRRAQRQAHHAARHRQRLGPHRGGCGLRLCIAAQGRQC